MAVPAGINGGQISIEAGMMRIYIVMNTCQHQRKKKSIWTLVKATLKTAGILALLLRRENPILLQVTFQLALLSI